MKRQSVYNKRTREKNKKDGLINVRLTIPAEDERFFKFMADVRRKLYRGEL